MTENNLSAICCSSCSEMEDVFSRLLTLASYITRRVIEFFEDLVIRDVSRWLEESEINSCGQHLTSPTCNDNKLSSMEDASSSRCCNSDTTFSFHEQGASDVEDQSFLYSRLEIVNRNYCRGVRFIFKGWSLRFVGWCSLYYVLNLLGDQHWQLGDILVII